MLERDKTSSQKPCDAPFGQSDMMAVEAASAGGVHDVQLDNELQAAIEYKIASCGVVGAGTVLDLLNTALRRLVR
ncbi:MAG: hypothetical protein AAGJ94_11365 [Pseudomonadota bacterium]